MLPGMKKRTFLLILTVILSVGLLIPGTCSANTTSLPLDTPNIVISSDPQNLGTIQICERDIPSLTPRFDSQIPLQIKVSLPSGARYAFMPAPGDESSYMEFPATYGSIPNALKSGDIKINSTSTSRVLILDLWTRSNLNGRAAFNLIFNKEHSRVIISSSEDDFVISLKEEVIEVETYGKLTDAKVVNAYFNGGFVTAQNLGNPSLTSGVSQPLGTLKLVENRPGVLQAGQKAISLTLPKGVVWNRANLKLGGGFLKGDVSTGPIEYDEAGNSRLWLNINHNSLDIPWPLEPAHRTNGEAGIIELNGYVNVLPTAAPGKIILDIGGQNQTISPKSINLGVIGGTEVSSPHTSRFIIGQEVFTMNGIDAVMEAPPYIKEGRTYLPLRYVAYALGISDEGIMWDASNQMVSLVKGNKYIKMQIGHTTLWENDKVTEYMDVAPEINNGLTMLPVGIIVDKMGGQIDWDPSSQELMVTYPKPSSQPGL